MAKAKVAGGVKAVWTAATENPHTELLKQDVMDVLEIARSKVKRAPSSTETKATVVSSKIEPRVNPDVGAELLSHFKTQWGEMHQSIEETSESASTMDFDLKTLHQSVARSHAIIRSCAEEFGRLRHVVEALDEAQSKVEAIGDLMRKVEDAIHEYSLAKVELEAERQNHSLTRQHEREISGNRNKVEHLRKVLQNEQQLSLDLKHKIENKELKERQMAFQEMFDKQMADYRTRGEVVKPISEIRERSQSQLEEVVIEDKDGTASLHEFLSDVVLDDTEENRDNDNDDNDQAPTKEENTPIEEKEPTE